MDRNCTLKIYFTTPTLLLLSFESTTKNKTRHLLIKMKNAINLNLNTIKINKTIKALTTLYKNLNATHLRKKNLQLKNII